MGRTTARVMGAFSPAREARVFTSHKEQVGIALTLHIHKADGPLSAQELSSNSPYGTMAGTGPPPARQLTVAKSGIAAIRRARLATSAHDPYEHSRPGAARELTIRTGRTMVNYER